MPRSELLKLGESEMEMKPFQGNTMGSVRAEHGIFDETEGRWRR